MKWEELKEAEKEGKIYVLLRYACNGLQQFNVAKKKAIVSWDSINKSKQIMRTAMLCFMAISHLVKYFDKVLLFTPLQKGFAYPALLDVHGAILKYISLRLWLVTPFIDNCFEDLRGGRWSSLGNSGEKC